MKMIHHKIHHILVMENNRLRGMATNHDFMALQGSSPTALVKDLMSTDVQTISPDTSLAEIAELFLRERYRRLPVVDKGRLVGQVSRRDVVRAIEKIR
jgi:CBS domain-containing protein